MTKDDIKAAVSEAIQENIRDFYIDRETHYKQHEFLGEMMKWIDDCKSTASKTIVKILVYGLLGAMMIGFCIKYSVHVKIPGVGP
jgi:hypothetical protein